MFERFTEQARQVVVRAQREARALKHDHIGTEHILLGLLGDDGGLAGRALKRLDVTAERVRAEVVRFAGSGGRAARRQVPFTPRAKKVLELALREALSLRDNYIGTEHILLGLVREKDGLGARILVDLDADCEKVRAGVIGMLCGPGRPAHRANSPAPPVQRVTEDPAGAALPDLGAESDEALEDLVGELTEHERAVSHERRILHAKIDVLRAELVNRRRGRDT